MPIIRETFYNHPLTMDCVILKMNYLAHAFLSFKNADILAGNMISDYVKGKKKFDYSAGIQKGIQLHRLIDEFTDSHEVTARAKDFFRPQYRLYSGAFVDVVYDHFLALDKNQFNEHQNLEHFCQETYQLLENNFEFFPLQFQKVFPYMKMQNWLYNYQFKEGIQKSFQGLVYRATYLNESIIAYEIFNKHYEELKSCYAEFFPELKQYACKNAHHLWPD
jgi:acyl carrier protein phosphodiesterase